MHELYKGSKVTKGALLSETSIHTVHDLSSMAESRPKRANAGRNIGKLINQELGGDDFYSTVYGGFAEDEEDQEYEVISTISLLLFCTYSTWEESSTYVSTKTSAICTKAGPSLE